MPDNEKRTSGASEADDVRFTLNMPRILHGRMMQEVRKRQAEFSRYSLADWIKEACRARMDCPAPPPPMPVPQVQYQTSTPQGQIPAGIGRGMVGQGFWDQWSRESKRLEGEARDESFNAALEERKREGLILHPKWDKMGATARLAWLRANDTEDSAAPAAGIEEVDGW